MRLKFDNLFLLNAHVCEAVSFSNGVYFSDMHSLFRFALANNR